MRILIAVPTFENITPDTFKAIWDLDKGDHKCDFEFVRGYDCAAARNRIARLAIDGAYDAVLMVDNDVTPPRDALLNLLSHDVDFVSGYYLHRNNDNKPGENTCACRLYQPDGTPYFNYPLSSEYTGKELHKIAENGQFLLEIHGGGMGCALVKTDVFHTLPYPWFDWVNYDNGNVLSEDLFFCERMRKADIPRYVDTRVACGHLFRRIATA